MVLNRKSEEKVQIPLIPPKKNCQKKAIAKLPFVTFYFLKFNALMTARYLSISRSFK
jgi:hypothetical protein